MGHDYQPDVNCKVHESSFQLPSTEELQQMVLTLHCNGESSFVCFTLPDLICFRENFQTLLEEKWLLAFQRTWLFLTLSWNLNTTSFLTSVKRRSGLTMLRQAINCLVLRFWRLVNIVRPTFQNTTMLAMVETANSPSLLESHFIFRGDFSVLPFRTICKGQVL